MKKFFGLFLFFISGFSFAQSDSCSIRISLLTCTPGEELYTIFGHSAIRVVDRSANTDLVFNYGTFDFDDPNFYEKFVKGNLLYFVSVDSFPSFMWEYEYFKRGVTEQVINISCSEKHNLMAVLFENAKEENRYYRYDFTHDNCTTRLRDMLEKISNRPMLTKNIVPHKRTTFRHLLHEYLNKGGWNWVKLGMDILLGSPMDKKASNRDAMYLPDYLMKAFDSTVNNDQPLVGKKNLLIPEFVFSKSKSVFIPIVLFSTLFLFITLFSISKSSSWVKTFIAFDFFFFFVLGLMGMLLLFTWFGTSQPMFKNNFNLLLALPVHLPMAFMIFSKKRWVKKYFRFMYFFSIVFVGAWFLLPQQLNLALLPILGIVLVRSFYRARNSH